ncbi:hypothetical protein CC1G_00898 [Coprinopsis cinerea okayama7|uniref:F-box domain-containing protein n=1 Tax=Coprinopsis cinerea (strain Okayama-7 / 130 / ATCC MYA-4618 / FGSC 9003) TaxID=240176 RepID=A8N923_COPC7|nr:hypothetical protein CC1G_00898 [Coprinopsis cinerea okayama7\|eukprot:XP_001831351.2 hypothetical protein CC1G_00898 [Coprinopsis cinerea okayama7\
MIQLSDLPVEILQDNLFPFLSAKSLTRLTCTSKYFARLCCDDAVWKRKLLADFNFSGEGTARTSGWKTIYRGLYNPKVFVWGEAANGRLGTAELPRASTNGVPFPFELKIPNVRIVSIVAGGMSFHALDSNGNVFVWGTLNATSGGYLPSDGFSEAGKRAGTPLKLRLPSGARSVSCGRLHSCILDNRNRIWTFVNWGRPFRFISHALDNPLSPPVQVECGWSFSALLNTAGEVFVWWPFSGSLQAIVTQKNGELDAQGEGAKAKATTDGVIACIPWSVSYEPKRLPGLPPLPDLPLTGVDIPNTLQLIQIAGMDGHLIGLTNAGHVLKFGTLEDENSVTTGRWEYLPKFSDLNFIRQNKCFSGDERKIDPPQTLQITHITANFQHFVAYSTGSSSIVLIGNTQTTPDSDPEIKPELQNRSVISVVVGDYHNAALTSTGKLFTWGQFSAGALGLGDPAKLQPGQPGGYGLDTRRRVPPPVTTPTEVRFDHGLKKPKDRFCFAVTAAGWHTGALAIDLEPDGEEDVNATENDPDPEESPSHRVRALDPNRDRETEETVQYPPLGIFRVGHAGRGRGRGLFGRGFGRVLQYPEPRGGGPSQT